MEMGGSLDGERKNQQRQTELNSSLPFWPWGALDLHMMNLGNSFTESLPEIKT